MQPLAQRISFGINKVVSYTLASMDLTSPSSAMRAVFWLKAVANAASLWFSWASRAEALDTVALKSPSFFFRLATPSGGGVWSMQRATQMYTHTLGIQKKQQVACLEQLSSRGTEHLIISPDLFFLNSQFSILMACFFFMCIIILHNLGTINKR